jgi:hypothetical protein
MSLVSIIGQVLIIVILGYVCLEVFLQIRRRIFEAHKKGELKDFETFIGKIYKRVKKR